MKSRINDAITVFLIQLVLTLPLFAANVSALSISNVRVTKVEPSSATIEWDTDALSSTKVKYGVTGSYGYTESYDNSVQHHVITLINNIISGTSYYFAVESKDSGGAIATDNNFGNSYTFSTPDIVPPSQVGGLKLASATKNSVFLAWSPSAEQDLSHYAVYKNQVLIANATTNSFNDSSFDITKNNVYRVAAVDESNNTGAQSNSVSIPQNSLDFKAPVISNLNVITVTDTSALITWMTDEKSTTVVSYGIDAPDSEKVSDVLETSHSMPIDGLTQGTKYLFASKSCDQNDNCANSEVQSFVAGVDTAAPFISLSLPRYINRRSIDLTGSTKPFSSITLFVNDMSVPKRSIDGNDIGSSGKFSFTQVQLDKENAVKLVAVDKSGNKEEKSFDISVDTEEPAIVLGDLPSFALSAGLKISGTSNEPVTISVFVDSTAKFREPSKVTGLIASKIGKNSVVLKWDESKDSDFSHYVIYRLDSGPIAVTKPANFNLFIDALVDSGKSYTYEVSAVNMGKKEGPKSDPLSVSTLAGGLTLNAKHDAVDIFEGIGAPEKVFNASGNFEFVLDLNKGDGTYSIRLEIEDRAGNAATIEKTILVDTKKPDVKIISPGPGTSLYENVANEVDISGRTKPNARVHLFVDRTPFTFYDTFVTAGGLPNEAQGVVSSAESGSFDAELKGLEERLVNLSARELEAECRSSAGSSCRTGADKSVTADGDGNFVFEKVDLTADFGLATRLTQVPPTDFRDVQLNQEAKGSKLTNIVVIASDQAGLKGVAAQPIRIINCWSGNLSWDMIPLTEYQTPTILSTERMAEGTETLYFYFKYSYVGRGSNPKLLSVSLSKACSSREQADPRYNLSCLLMQAGAAARIVNPPDNTITYSAVPLSRMQGMDKFLENDWKGFKNALGVNDDLAFPFKAMITYEHDVQKGDGTIGTVRETQTSCQEVSYFVDDTLIDPRNILHPWLLNNFVGHLQSAIDALSSAQEQIKRVMDYVGQACLWTYLAHTVYKIYRTWIDLSNEKLFNLKNLIFSTGIQANDEYCQQAITNVKAKFGSLKLKYLSDPDLKKCFLSSYNAWQNEAKLYEWQRWSCDRIFGHSSPSRWTETVDNENLTATLDSQKACEGDEAVQGQPLRAEKCRSFGSSIPEAKAFGADEKCVLVRFPDNSESLYVIQKPVPGSEDLYELKYVSGLTTKPYYAIKDSRSEDYFLTARPKTCKEICGLKEDNNKQNLISDKPTPNPAITTEPRLKVEKYGVCISSQACSNIITGKKAYIGNQELNVLNAEKRGYASNCFYDDGDNVNVVSSTSAQTREECCCINSKGKEDLHYYEPGDISLYNGAPVHESKTVPDTEPIAKPKPDGGEEKYSDMKWSYRYSRIGFESVGTGDGGNVRHNRYNPSRYIEGRDLPACFGQDNLFYKLFNKEKEIVIVNPFKQHTAALQCAYLTGIDQRLQLFKNVMAAMSNCLIEVRNNGRADVGVCKELFTQHVCGLVWQGIKFMIDGCTPPADSGVDEEYRSESITEKLGLGLKGIAQGITESQQELSEDYGNAKLNNLLGVGEGGVARKMCLAAFGYDWSLNANNLVDAAYAAPFATLVQAVTRSREFLTVDPQTLKPKFEYRASWLINPGCELDGYDIQLACVTRKEMNEHPDEIDCGAVGASSILNTGQAPFTGSSSAYSNCDCIDQPFEQTMPFFYEGRKKQNQLVDMDRHDVIDSQYRYDHLKITLHPDRRIPAGMRENCFPTGHENGVFYFPLTDKTASDIADCSVNPLSGTFTCKGGIPFQNVKGTAHLVEFTINGEKAENFKEIKLGDKLRVGAKVSKTGKDKCMRVSISPDAMSPLYRQITLDGINDVPEITISDSIRITTSQGSVYAPNIAYKLIQQPSEPITINAEFKDTPLNEEKSNIKGVGFYSEDDKIVIQGVEVSLQDQNVRTYSNNGIKITVLDVQNPSSQNLMNKILEIEMGGAKIQITGVSYQQAFSGVYELKVPILINSVQESAQTSQQKMLKVELFQLKDTSPAFTNIEDCNLNDKIMENIYKFTVTDKGADTSIRTPIISGINFDFVSQVISKPVKITTTITHPSGISKAYLSVIGPDNSIVKDKEIMIRNLDTYSYTFDTSAASKEGSYTARIDAVSNSGTTSTKDAQFTLRQKTT